MKQLINKLVARALITSAYNNPKNFQTITGHRPQK